MTITEDWDFYLCRVNDQPASIFLDLALKPQAPMPDYPVLHWVFLRMQRPRPDGLSSSDEAPTLHTIEHALVPALKAEHGLLYVGRNTNANHREFYFYAVQGVDIAETAARVIAGFSGYSYEVGSEDDPLWTQYRDVLYPSRAELRWIGDRRVIEALHGAGDPVSRSRTIRHYLYFPTPQDRQEFLDLIGDDLVVPDDGITEAANGERRFGVRLEQQMIPSLEAVNAVTSRLEILSVDRNGEYDGWEAEVLKPSLSERLKA